MIYRQLRPRVIIKLIAVVGGVLFLLGAVSRLMIARKPPPVVCGKKEYLDLGPPPQDRIPKRVHQIFRDALIPEPYHQYVKSWRTINPSWEYFFWTDQDAEAMIRDKYPQYVDLYNSYNHRLQKSDAMRYFILHQYGGVYSDLDVQALKPLDEFIATKTCIISPEPTVQTNLIYNLDQSLTNCIMASSARHPFIEYLLESLRSSHRTVVHNWDVLHSTGPFFLNKTYNSYQANNPACRQSAVCSVFIADHKYLVPTIDVPDLKTNADNICNKPERGDLQRKACEYLKGTNFQNDIPQEAYTNHHWLHLGWATTDQYFSSKHICDIMPNALSYTVLRKGN